MYVGVSVCMRYVGTPWTGSGLVSDLDLGLSDRRPGTPSIAQHHPSACAFPCSVFSCTSLVT